MTFLTRIKEKIGGLIKTPSRYPTTVFFFLAAALVNTIAIEQGEDYSRYLLTFLVGAFLGFVLQAIWERFFTKTTERLTLLGLGLVLTFAYFLMVGSLESIDVATGIRTAVILSMLAIAYIWIPSIKSRESFNNYFLIAFKAFFNALLFSAILLLGFSLIIGALDLLLFNLPNTFYDHNLNLVGIIFAPLYFLSLMPIYPGKNDSLESQEGANKDNQYPKFLEVLISYIIIPLLSVYTVILVVYIVINVRSDFWTDNRLEPMLIGFAIAVIVVYILASKLKNPFVFWFQKIFPKVLVIIVLFQIIASILKIQEMGITHGRYYVILFGFFAIVSGIILSFRSMDNIDKNGIIAVLFIGCSLFSIIPPLDAFTISRNNQMTRLTSILTENNMLVDQKIISNSEISKKDQEIISTTLNYLLTMDYEISYLAEDFDLYEDFYETFGFYQYFDYFAEEESIYLDIDPQAAIDVSNFDTLLNFSAYCCETEDDEADQAVLIGSFEQSGSSYSLLQEGQSQVGQLILKDQQGQVLIALEMKEVFDYFARSQKDNSNRDNRISADEATFTLENDQVVLALVVKFIAISKGSDQASDNGDFYVMIKIKE